MINYFQRNKPRLQKITFSSCIVRYDGPAEGGPLFDGHLNIVTAFLRDRFFMN